LAQIAQEGICEVNYPSNTAKNQQNGLNMGKNRLKPQETCGKHGLDLDFNHLKAAL
jgi:hypothetical protein